MKSMPKLVTLLAVALSLLVLLPAAAMSSSGAQEITPVSLTIAKADKDATFNFDTGTRVKLKVVMQSAVMKLDKAASTLELFTDEHGIDLVEKGRQWRQQQSYFTTRDENGIDFASSEFKDNIMYVPISVNAVPESGSRTIRIKGTLAVHGYPDEGSKRLTAELVAQSGLDERFVFSDHTLGLVSSGSANMNGTDYNMYRLDTDVIIYDLSLIDAKGKVLTTLHYPGLREDVMIEPKVAAKVKKIKLVYGIPSVNEAPFDITLGVGW